MPWYYSGLADDEPVLEWDSSGADKYSFDKYVFSYVSDYENGEPVWCETVLDCGYDTGHMEFMSEEAYDERMRWLRSEYMEAGRLDSPADWVCFILPVGVGILLQPLLRFTSEILSWAIVLVVVVVLFVLMQMIKPYISKKKTEAEALEEIKNYYYERYKKTGKLDKLEPWND